MEVLSGLNEFRVIIKDGEYIIRDCKIAFLHIVDANVLLIENSEIGSLSGNGVIEEVKASQMFAIRDDTVIQKASGASRLGCIHDRVVIRQLCDDSEISMLQDDSRVERLEGNTEVNVLRYNKKRWEKNDVE